LQVGRTHEDEGKGHSPARVHAAPPAPLELLLPELLLPELLLLELCAPVPLLDAVAPPPPLFEKSVLHPAAAVSAASPTMRRKRLMTG